MSEDNYRTWKAATISAESTPLTSQLIEMAIDTVTGDYAYVNAWSVEDWTTYGKIPPQFAHLPNAIAAQEVMSSPLWKALNEEK